ncbi:MAG TPA: Stp1/IreP family PP2C-type Ser/Thr phosphatase [Solirubrobacteraceae bacterium]|jgi:protein phosphatase|nr:Stp1/IreP family PP2C-type Ser/Thr phosphatase [Solirubrobacteraceae bacterium]
MLRAAEDHFARSDTGRQRRANEDACFARAPVFVVADGMGGAQAGEVASRLAVEEFSGGLPAAPGSPEERLAERARAANVRIHRLSTEDSAHAGMGTTLTAVYVDEQEVSIAHVGDSRAYCLRDGELTRLTDDHSLVEELMRQGRLTPEEASEHPQRSIITRALGPEENVEVDTRTHRARAGDVYLLCSDGLTSMLSEPEIADILRSTQGLEQAGESLIRAANSAGGRDNITVVLFRLEEVAGSHPGGADQPTMAGRDLTAEEVRAGLASAGMTAGATPGTAGATAGPSTGMSSTSQRLPRTPRPPVAAVKRRRRRWPLRLLAVLVVLGLLGAGGWIASQSVYFIGTDSNGLVTMYRGVPYDLPGGVALYSSNFVSGVSAQAIAPGRRRRLLDHKLRSHDDAAGLMHQLELGRITG